MTQYTLERDVTTEECSWLKRDYKKGEVVYRYTGATYGCIGSGVPVTEQEGVEPFFEIPADAVGEFPRYVYGKLR